MLRDALNRCGAVSIPLDKRVDDDAEGLSAGERRRVALARALVRVEQAGAGLLVLDEPTAGLDPAQRHSFREVLKSVPSGDQVVVVSTHLVDDIEDLYDRVVVMNEGCVIFAGTPDEFINLSEPGPNRAERSYLGLVGSERA